MKESTVSIPLSGVDLNIYGTLRGDYRQPLIILCHGYGGWRHEMLMYNGARALELEGFSTLRLSMYGGGEKSRDIVGSDVITHSNDIDDAVAFVRTQGAKWVGVAGHSYSGMAIVHSQIQDFDAAALWDPTHTDGEDSLESKEGIKKDFVFVDSINGYVCGKGAGLVWAKTIVDNAYPRSREAASKFKVPTSVINAGNAADQCKYGKDYATHIDASTEHIIIPNAWHPFTEDGAAEKLFTATASYFRTLL